MDGPRFASTWQRDDLVAHPKGRAHRGIASVAARLLCKGADEVRALEMGIGEVNPSEHGPAHLDSAQIEAREISPGQIG